MEWQQLLGFYQVAKLGSFTKAAEATFRTQSALSQQVKALEDELGARLLERLGKRRLKLTVAGERLLEFVPAPPPGEARSRVLDRFYRPPRQAALGEFLARRALATCCMDLSDGLVRDLDRLCKASGCGAEVEAACLPMDGALVGLPWEKALDFALRGGEDQILLFAIPPERAQELDEAPSPVHRIGRLVSGGALDLLVSGGGREALALQGFDHFTP